jgi:hypothetical protein
MADKKSRAEGRRNIVTTSRRHYGQDINGRYVYLRLRPRGKAGYPAQENGNENRYRALADKRQGTRIGRVCSPPASAYRPVSCLNGNRCG